MTGAFLDGLVVGEVERQLSLIEAQDRAIAVALRRADGLRRGLLQRAFSGCLVSQDAGDEPASVLLERIAGAILDDIDKVLGAG